MTLEPELPRLLAILGLKQLIHERRRIANALTVAGWMLPAELQWLANQATKRKLIVEIGSWMGRSTRALADNAAGVVYAVDTWKGTEGDEAQSGQLHGKGADYLFEQFTHNMKGCENVVPMRMTSAEAANKLAHLRPDLVFIDGAHDCESVRRDILAWRPLLAERHILCGHDYRSCADVARAVSELLPSARPAIVDGDIWFTESQQR